MKALTTDSEETRQRLSNWRGRDHRRFELHFPVRIKFTSGSDIAEIEGISQNISMGGLLVRSALAIPPNASVTFVLSVNGRSSVRPIHLMGKGLVVRVSSGEDNGTFVAAVQCTVPVIQLENYLPDESSSGKR